MKRVAVLFGGWSVEREISAVSGKAVADGLAQHGYDVAAIDLRKGELPRLIEALAPPPDAVFNALHGRWGEDGSVQGLMELMGIPYTHSGVLASALAMDKPMARRLFAAAGLRCPEGKVIERAALGEREPMARPYVVKPTNEGSSVGVRIVQEGDNEPLSPADWPTARHLLVERYVPGRELTVAVMGDRPLAVTELRPKVGFYDYAAKYTEGKTQHLVPAPLPGAVYEAALDVALKAHAALGCRGVSRADLRFDERVGGAAGLYLLEVNTQPGMTPLSLVPEQAAHVGIPFPDLVAWMVEHAQCDA